MHTLAVLALMVVCFSFYMLARNEFAYKASNSALNAILALNLEMIDNHKYFNTINSDDVMIKYDKIMWDLFNWDKYAAVKPEFRSTIKPYFERPKII